MYTVDMITSRQMGENAYVLYQEGKDQCIVVDPGEKMLKDHPLLQGKALLAVLLTHGHFDHISGIDDLIGDENIPLYIHPEDEPMLYHPGENLSKSFGIPFTVKAKATPVTQNSLTIGNFHFQLIHTPGHTKGGLCYQIGSHLFTGDTLFNRGIGRMDFPGGSEEEMVNSLKRLIRLEDETIVYPGHNSIGTMKECREYLYESGILHQ